MDSTTGDTSGPKQEGTETKKTIDGEISILADRIFTARNLIFGESPDIAEDTARPTSSQLDGIIIMLDRLNEAMVTINKELELLK